MGRAAHGEALWALMHPAEQPWVCGGSEEYHGPHLGQRKAACTAIEWQARFLPLVRMRVGAHTCECMVTVYEVGAFGGKYLIRRTTRSAEGDRVAETEHLGARDAGDLWSRLLRGDSR